MTVIDWPDEVLKHVESSYFIEWRNRSAGVSIVDHEQIISPGIGIWQISLKLNRVTDQTSLKLFEALTARMQGRFNIARFSVKDLYRYSARVSPKQQPFSDGTFFDDDTGFVTEGVQEMTATAAAAIGDTSLSVNLENPTRPTFRIDDHFSFNDFLYKVVDVVGSNVEFLPRLRTEIPDGGVLQTDPPMIQASFADDQQGRRFREFLRYGAPTTLDFVEAFQR